MVENKNHWARQDKDRFTPEEQPQPQERRLLLQHCRAVGEDEDGDEDEDEDEDEGEIWTEGEDLEGQHGCSFDECAAEEGEGEGEDCSCDSPSAIFASGGWQHEHSVLEEEEDGEEKEVEQAPFLGVDDRAHHHGDGGAADCGWQEQHEGAVDDSFSLIRDFYDVDYF